MIQVKKPMDNDYSGVGDKRYYYLLLLFDIIFLHNCRRKNKLVNIYSVLYLKNDPIFCLLRPVNRCTLWSYILHPESNNI